jgi:hypothetical protein
MNAPIADPRHSRPIDVHRWSEHPEAAELVGRLWASHYQDFDQPGRPGPKPKTSFKQQFRALLLDLFVAWKTDPELCIGVPMSSNGWQTSSRYNALGLSKKMIPIVRRAHEVGLIDFASGSYAGPYGRGNRNSRIRASTRLQELFSGARIDLEDVTRHPRQECILLTVGKQLIEYEDDNNTRAMRERLTAYNQLLLRTFIDIPQLQDPFIERPITTNPPGRRKKVFITSDRKFVRRIFSRGRWDLNGRFYGPWWQQIGQDWRSQIHINGQPTVEIDFKGLHINLLALEQGPEIHNDPYTLRHCGLPEVNDALQRELVKKLVLRAINAGTRPAAFSSFRDDWPTGHLAKRLTDQQLSTLLDLFISHHPLLAEKLCTDQGIRLMFLDSQITDQVLTVATNLGLPVLGVHDSFIVAREEKDTLLQVVHVATKELIGQQLPVQITEPTRTERPTLGYLMRKRREEEESRR